MKKNKVLPIQCPLCEFTSKQEVCFKKHLLNVHNLNDEQQFQLYLDTFHNGKHPTCTCSNECQEKLSWNGWKKGITSKFVRGHNAVLDTCWRKPEFIKLNTEKRQLGYSLGKYSVWNKGLTKETDVRIQNIADKSSSTLISKYESGELIDWRILNPQKAIEVANKSSNTKKLKYALGETISWNLGLTKETDERLFKASIKISKCYESPNMGRRVKLVDLEKRIKKFADKFILISSLESYKGFRKTKLQFKCLVCGEVQFKTLAMLEETPRCFKCEPKGSYAEVEIFDFIKSLGFDVIRHDRKLIFPRELDLYVPEKKFAIEFNGNYWHSTDVNNEQSLIEQQQFKFDSCQKQDIDLLVIYEDEWQDKKELVKNLIKTRLEINDNDKFLQEEFLVIELNDEIVEDFYEKYYIGGYQFDEVVTKTFGLLDKSSQQNLYAILTFKEYDDICEVIATHCIDNIKINNWFVSLTQAVEIYAKFLNKRLIATIDNRLESNKEYLKNGWEIVDNYCQTQFWYTYSGYRFTQYEFDNLDENINKEKFAKIFCHNKTQLKYAP